MAIRMASPKPPAGERTDSIGRILLHASPGVARISVSFACMTQKIIDLTFS